MPAQTIIRVNLLSKFSPVDYATIARVNSRKNARFMLYHDGIELVVNADELARIFDHEDYIKILSERGNFAIVQSTLIAILED